MPALALPTAPMRTITKGTPARPSLRQPVDYQPADSLVYAYVERKHSPFPNDGLQLFRTRKSGGNNSSSMEESMAKGRPRKTWNYFPPPTSAF
jgi:hypothetical protein